MATPGQVTDSGLGVADDEDPRIRRVYRRLRMLTIIAALTMGVGFAAIMSVIAYRLVKAGDVKRAAATPHHLALPAGSRVVSTAADGGRLLVTVEAAGVTVVHVFDAASLAPTGRLEITSGPAAAPPSGAPSPAPGAPR